MTTKHIGILLFDGMEELDAVGPWEVFAWWTQNFPDDGYAATTFSLDGQPVTSAKTLVIQPHQSRDTVPPLEVLLYPGGHGTRPQCKDADHLDWLRQQRERVPLITSVCTGALPLAAAGLLHNRPATTYHTAMTELAELDPTIDVRAGERYVDDGDVITSAGVSAGIDMALYLVGRLISAERAGQVRRGIEYEPALV
jgi:transcriptional regulator GlxA family with amidase domain